jgi:hypothetical protein
LTTEEELNRLEDNLRRLRIEYESYFSGGLRRPPRDSAYRVESALKRLAENMGEFNLRQRYRFNQLQQKYMVYGGLWRKRLRDLEEGRARQTSAPASESGPFRIVLQAPEAETEKVNQIFDTWMEAKRQMGEPAPTVDREVFAEFVRQKTAEIRQKLGCTSVGFCVKVEEGRVKLKAGRG